MYCKGVCGMCMCFVVHICPIGGLDETTARHPAPGKKAAVLAFLAAALTTPVGTLISFPMISQIDKPVLGALLSVSAGALVYVGATHLLPHAERESAKYSLVALLGGILVALGIVLSKG